MSVKPLKSSSGQRTAEWSSGSALSVAIQRCGGPGTIAAVGLLILVGLRILISFSPEQWWSGDPRVQSGVFTDLGPAAAAVIDWLSVAVLGLTVWHAIRRSARLRWGLMALWAAGVGFALWQGTTGLDSLRIGGHWIGALALALAAAHLGASFEHRRLLLAGLIALIVPLGAQALHQVLIEHPRTVQNYEQNTEQVLQQRGIEPGSVEQRRYERRLYQVEARGRFSLTNVFGTVTLSLTFLALGAAAGSFLQPNGPRFKRADAIGLAALGALGVTLIGLTFSKGAVLALGLTGGAMAAGCVIAWRLRLGAGWWRLVALGLVALPIVAVLIRGAMGPPETAAGERSLLFRHQYWQGAMSMLSEHPLSGVGPGAFQEAYLVHKPPLSPEEVADPHNVFIAYLSMLGVGGLSWCLLLIGLLWLAGRKDLASNGSLPELPPEVRPPSARRRWAISLTAGGLLFAAIYVRELGYLGFPALVMVGLGAALLGVAWKARQDGRGVWAIGLGIAALAVPLFLLSPVGVWWIGAVGFIGLMGWLSGRRTLDSQPARLGLFAAATALLLHAQLEMSMTNTMAAPLLGAVLGLAAADPVDPANPGDQGEQRDQETVPHSRWLRGVTASLAPLVLVAMLIWHTPWIVRDQAAKAEAAQWLRQGVQSPASAARARSAAIDAMDPPDRYPADAERATHAARLLMEQALYHHRAGRIDQRDQALERAMQVIERGRQTSQQLTGLWRLQLQISQRAGSMTESPAGWRDRALEAAQHLLEHDPYGIRSYLVAADAAWEAGRFEEAEQRYRRTLELSEAAYLDPMKQLSDRQRRRIRQRLNEGAGTGENPP